MKSEQRDKILMQINNRSIRTDERVKSMQSDIQEVKVKVTELNGRTRANYVDLKLHEANRALHSKIESDTVSLWSLIKIGLKALKLL